MNERIALPGGYYVDANESARGVNNYFICTADGDVVGEIHDYHAKQMAMSQPIQVALVAEKKMREALENLIRCSNAIAGASPSDPDAMEAFDMFIEAKRKAREALAAAPVKDAPGDAKVDREKDEADAKDIFLLARMVLQQDADGLPIYSEGRVREFLAIFRKAALAERDAEIERLVGALHRLNSVVDDLQLDGAAYEDSQHGKTMGPATRQRFAKARHEARTLVATHKGGRSDG